MRVLILLLNGTITVHKLLAATSGIVFLAHGLHVFYKFRRTKK